MQKIILNLLCFFSLQYASAQQSNPSLQNELPAPSENHTLLVYYTDSTQVPGVQASAAKGKAPEIKSNDSKLLSVYKENKLIKAERAFPAAANFLWHPKAARLLNYYLLTFEGPADTALNQLDKIKAKGILSKQIYTEPRSFYVPNDYYTLSATGVNEPKSSALEFIGARAAWDVTKGSPDIKIGILDEYFDTTCAELTTKAEFLPGIVTNNYGGHGTRVACIAAGATDNGAGLPSIGFNSRLICGPKSYNAILDVAYRGAKVVNCSWGQVSNMNSTTIHNDIIDIVTSMGVTVVSSAGNGELGAGKYCFPASTDNVISVTSIGHLYERGDPLGLFWKDVHIGQLAVPNGIYTNTHNDKVDICAPGYKVYSTGGNNKYDYGYGSSFAAPFVSGTAALLYAIKPDITPQEVEEILKCSAVNIYTIENNKPFIGLLGAGRLDAAAATQLAKQKLQFAKPQGIKWYGIAEGSETPIQPNQFANYSSLTFKVVDAGAAAGTLYEWQINSLNTIIYRSGASITVKLAELELSKGNACQHLEVRVRKGTGCSASYYYTEKRLCPLADFSATSDAAGSCTGNTVTFFNKSVDGETFLWNFGDGATSTEKSPVHVYTSAGTKTITLTVNGTFIKTGTVTITPGSNFSINGISDNLFFCENMVTAFSYTGGNCGANLVWNFGDATAVSSEKAPVHTYTSKGPFTVTLTIDNLITITKRIFGKSTCNNFEIIPASSICANTRFAFSIPPAGGCASIYEWNFGNGQTSTYQNPPAVDFLPGIYTVKLKLNNQVVISKTVSAGLPFANFSYVSANTTMAGEPLFIAGLPVNFKNRSVCATSFRWEFGDGTVSTDENPVKTYPLAGTYTVKLFINGSTLLTMERTISMNCGKPINITYSINPDRSVTLNWTASATGNSFMLRYKKENTDSWIVVNNVVPPYTLTGLVTNSQYYYSIYSVCANGTPTASDYNSFTTGSPCAASALPVAASYAISGPPCTGATLQLKANLITGCSYQWSGPNSFTSTLQSPVVTNVTTAYSGAYTCKVSQGACVVSSETVNVTISALPDVPATMATSEIKGNSAVLNWTNPTAPAVVSLQYKKQADNNWTTINNVAAPYTLTGLSINTTYNWQVKAAIGACATNWSAQTTFKTNSSCDGPATTTVSAITSSSAQISWPAVGPGVSSYQVSYRVAGTSTPFITASNGVSGTSGILSYTFTGLAIGASYEYRITPKCAAANAVSTLFTSGTFATTDCALPTMKPVSGITDNSAKINWENTNGIVALKAEIRPAGAENYTLVSSRVNFSALSILVSGLFPGTAYEYKLTPYCGPANAAKLGTASVTGNFTTENKICSGTSNRSACTGTISDGSGNNNYNNGMSCNWIVSVAGASSLTLNFTSLNTEKNNDIVKVYKGTFAAPANLVGTYSGNTPPPPITVNTGAMYITFTTNASVQGQGWEAKYYSSLCPAPANIVRPLTEEKLVNSISLYPNPYVDNVTIEMTRELENAQLILTNDNGQVVYRKQYDLMEKTVHIDFGTTIPVADYMLTIRNDDEIFYRQKLINQKPAFTKPVEISGKEAGINEISVYPNPYVDNLTIEMKKELQNVVLLMIDLQGRIVYKKEFSQMSGRTQIDFGRTLPAGVYLLVIRNTKEILFRQRVIAQK